MPITITTIGSGSGVPPLPASKPQLVGERPESFFRPPYVGHRGWLGVYLDVPVDWDEIADIVEQAYRTVASRRQVSMLS